MVLGGVEVSFVGISRRLHPLTARPLRIVMALVILALPVSAEASVKRETLRPGEAVFWTGPHLESGTETWTYELDVEGHAFRLRIGLDHPEVDDSYVLDIHRPGGGTTRVDTGGGLYSDEALIGYPEPGKYLLEVTGTDVTDSNFRLRAKLEKREPSLGTSSGPVLPNLQVLPAHAASFLFPATNGATPDPPTGIDLLGAESCHPEEHAEDQALRCLRFAFGVRNTGLGPLQMHYEGAGIGPDKPLWQRIQRADGSYFDRKAGLARFHKTHGHYHHDAAIGLRLFSVEDEKLGKLSPAGDKRTKGFAHREELLREWDTFYPEWTPFGFGLRPGWADIYEWNRPGNYIDFGLNGDGLYVIRMWADPVKGIRESNERDNVAYTYLKVTGSEVELLEAGRGTDPWDPCKIEVGFGGHPDPSPTRRPADCPPDTT